MGGIPLADATYYSKVKDAILHWLEVVKDLHYERFHGKKASGAGGSQQLVNLLWDEAQWWLLLQDRDSREITEIIILEQFIWDLEEGVKALVQQH